MSVMQQSSIPMPGFVRPGQRMVARHRIPTVRAVIAAVAWTLAGAGIALLVIVAAALALLRLTDMDGSSSASLDSPDGLVALGLPRDGEAPRWEQVRS